MAQELATISPPRLPFVAGVEERFGIDRASWKALVEAVFPAAKTTDAVVLALSYCKARRLDVFKRVVHIVPIWDNDAKRYIETVWPGIAEHRTTAQRTGQLDGNDECKFGPDVSRVFTGTTKNGADLNVSVTYPEWAQITVYKYAHGRRVPCHGPRVYWEETFSKRGRAEVPNDRWARAPRQMIEKCAEAAALRRAFPEELGDEGTAEEAGSRGAEHARDITPTDEPRPTRAQFVEKPATVDPLEDFNGDPNPPAAAATSAGDAGASEGTGGAEQASPASEDELRAPVPTLDVPPEDGTDKAWRTYAGLLREEIKHAPDRTWLTTFQEYNQDGMEALRNRSAIAAQAIKDALAGRSAELGDSSNG